MHHEELIGVNERGVSFNGDLPKCGLDPKILDHIKKFCIDQADDGTDKENLWRQCLTAMNKKISLINQINNKNS